MKVLIVSVNQCRQPAPVMPYGACLVAQAAQTAGHAVELLDMMFVKDPLRALDDRLKGFRPDVIGLSIRNIDNNDILNTCAYFTALPPIMRLIRGQSDAPVVLGGAAVAVMPRSLLELTAADWAVVGDGEAIFLQLLDALAQGRDGTGLPGLARVHGGRYAFHPAPQRTSLCDVTQPDFGTWLDLKAYRAHLTAAPLQTKRGCPFECVYCTYGAAEGKKYRLCSSAGVVENVQRMVRAGLNNIEIVDNVFNSPLEHAVSVCEALAASPVRARLQSLEMNPRFVTDELLTGMRRAGFVGMGITVESASDTVLAAMNKPYCQAEVNHTAEIVARHALPCLWIFMLGGPGETQQSVQDTLEFARRRIRRGDVASFTVGVRIYPGTVLEALARDEGVLTVAPETMLTPAFYISPRVDRAWLIHTVRQASADNLSFLSGSSLALPGLQRAFRVAGALGMKGPLWPRTRPIRRVLQMLHMPS